MAKLRKGVSYTNLERPYTRKSKYRAKNFVRAVPHSKLVRYVMGDPKREDWESGFQLLSEQPIQLRHNALESARMTANRLMERKLGKGQYFFRIRPYTHHVLRENRLASGAGADRLSTGMKKSFGNPVGIAAQGKKGQIVMEVKGNNEEIIKRALKRASYKLPGSYRIVEA